MIFTTLIFAGTEEVSPLEDDPLKTDEDDDLHLKLVSICLYPFYVTVILTN